MTRTKKSGLAKTIGILTAATSLALIGSGIAQASTSSVWYAKLSYGQEGNSNLVQASTNAQSCWSWRSATSDANIYIILFDETANTRLWQNDYEKIAPGGHPAFICSPIEGVRSGDKVQTIVKEENTNNSVSGVYSWVQTDQ
ncbi:hypothetical protein ACEZCY_04885 [Streptacidiphilus sp. N1-12]|uniref:Uncharacterized protein n=2 Tax=Streptacidiphilus alkalitolerans TaxID=3342712 RepID=A0ABV6W917_9ACTN